MNKKIAFSGLFAVTLALLLASPVILADDDDSDRDRQSGGIPGDVEPGDPWKVAPFDFLFGNHIDTHIQLELKLRKGEPKSLKGSLYIYYTGEIDEASGLPVARHPRGMMHDEVCGTSDIVCVAAWKVKGRPGAAKYLYHSGVNGNDHPVWMTNRAQSSSMEPGLVIPSPGAYSHYHWITQTSTDPRAGAVSPDCNKNNAGSLQNDVPTAVNDICQGWYLQIKATESFAFLHGGEVIPVYKGMDLRSHLNIVMNYTDTPVEPITPTRAGDSH